MPVVSIPFVVLAGDDVDGLHAEGVSRPERRRDVAEVGEALHDEAHGVAPALGGAADPVPARLEDVRLQHVHDLLARHVHPARPAERVQVRKPPAPPRRQAFAVGAALHLHEAAHPGGPRGGGLRGEELLDGVDALVGVGVRVSGGGGGEGGGAEDMPGVEVEAEEAERRMRESGARGIGGEGGGERVEG